MSRRFVLAVMFASLVPSGLAVASDAVDSAGGAMRPATRVQNQKPTQGPPAPPTGVVLAPELEIALQATNEFRISNGLAPLTLDPLLTQAAQGHSEDQAAMNLLTHTGSNGSSPGDRIDAVGYDWRTWAENAAAGYRTGATVVAAWINSPGHRSNLLNARITEVGMGLAYTADGYPYWTQAFAAPR